VEGRGGYFPVSYTEVFTVPVRGAAGREGGVATKREKRVSKKDFDRMLGIAKQNRASQMILLKQEDMLELEEEEGEWVRGLYTYTKTEGTPELSFGEGDLMKVLRRFPGGWMEVKFNDLTGFVPGSYVEDYKPGAPS